jgi:hypothetical protein
VNAPRFTSPYADEAIVAWLDGEMRAEDAQAFENELKRSETLSARTAELMKSNQPFADAFAPMLDEAPLERMESRLAYLLDNTPSAPIKEAVQVSRRALIAASVSFLLVGSAVVFGPDPSRKLNRMRAREYVNWKHNICRSIARKRWRMSTVRHRC